MSWASTIASGSGKVRYALVIEGWPDIFVTDSSITLASYAALQGRTVHTGLLRDGMEFSEQMIPQHGMSQCSGMRFRIRSTDQSDAAMASFTTRPTAVAYLEDSISSPTATTKPDLIGGATLTTGTYYYVGSECIRWETSSITRARRGTFGQVHSTSYFEGKQHVAVYDRPVTMDGSRVTLYAFGAGDDGTDLINSGGTPIWRGRVVKPPSLEGDGGTWSIDAVSVMNVLQQSVMSHEFEAHIVGYYHHAACPIMVFVSNEGTTGATYAEGFAATTDDLITSVNTAIASALTEAGITSTEVADITLAVAPNGGWQLIMLTGSTPADPFVITVGSAILGWFEGGNDVWTDLTGGIADATNLAADTQYTGAFHKGTFFSSNPEPSYPTTALNGPWSAHEVTDPSQEEIDEAAGLGLSPLRIYVDSDFSSLSGAYVRFENIAEGHEVDGRDLTGFLCRITDSGTANNAYYIEISVPHQQFRGQFFGYLGPDTVITPLLGYGYDTTVIGMVENFITEAAEQGNDGVTPYVTSGINNTDEHGDFPETGGGGVDWTIEGNQDDWLLVARNYAFPDNTTMADVLRGEVLMLGHVLRLSQHSQIELVPLPLFTATTPTDKTVNSDKIITPADGYGAWESYSVQDEGLVTQVTVHDGYDVIEDQWKVEHSFRDANAIAAHKNRGRGTLEIKPFSSSSLGVMEREVAQDVAQRFMELMARDYVAVTVQVPFTCFGYLCGDIVKLTSSRVPAGDGTRGVTNRRAVVMGRRWNLDPRRQEMGTLTLWMLLDEIGGYTPSAYVTGQTNDSGDTWTIDCDSANTFNENWSHDGDGLVLDLFEAGMFVQVVQMKDSSPTIVTGSVDSVDQGSDQIVVTFDSTWTPGSDDWVLEFQPDDGSTATSEQRQYAYVADDDATRADGNAADRFA